MDVAMYPQALSRSILDPLQNGQLFTDNCQLLILQYDFGKDFCCCCCCCWVILCGAPGILLVLSLEITSCTEGKLELPPLPQKQAEGADGSHICKPLGSASRMCEEGTVPLIAFRCVLYADFSDGLTPSGSPYMGEGSDQC